MNRVAGLPMLLVVAMLTPATGLAVAPKAGAACGPGQTLTIGVFPRRNPAVTDTMFSPIAERLHQALGCKVELKTASDFAHFWDGVEAQSYDLVHYNQYHYIRSAATYEVVAHNEEFGSGYLAGAIYTRRDSGINGLHDLIGKTVVFGGGLDAMVSHILPRYLLIRAGVKPDMHESVYAPNPPNAVLAVYYRQAAGGGAADLAMQLPIVASKIDINELRTIATSEPVIHLPWAVRRSLSEDTKRRIKEALLALGTDEAGRAALLSAGMTGIAPAADHDYDRCREIVHAVEEYIPLK